jgi:outer membrane receptor protein involved in Fe transport
MVQDTVPADTTVIPLEELRVEVSRLRLGGIPLDRAPLSAQVVGRAELDHTGYVTIADALATLTGVTVADQFGSPFQYDVRMRGFAVSPVVGLPQSVSVFVDGVRVNEADASQVHFNLIPMEELERIEVIRGPIGPFGKNTLAGALNLVTRRGEGPASGELEVRGGYYEELEGRGRAQGEVGPFDYYGAFGYYRSDGWRDKNFAEQLQGFAKVGWQGDGTDLWVSYTFADDSIEAPGSLPSSWLRGDLPTDVTDPPEDLRRLQFTGGLGDFFAPTLHFVNANLDRRLADEWSLQANAFGRFTDFRQFNDNITEPDALGLTGIGSGGVAVQVSHQPDDQIQVAFGAEYVRNDVDIEILQLPNEAFPDVPVETTTLAGTEEDNYGVYGEGWWVVNPRLSAYGSLRFDHVRLPFRDVLEPSNSGDNEFNQLTGTLGASWLLGEGFSVFGSYGRGFRAPVILEITCADPENPCPLPFELGADPPLDPVKTDTWQTGVRYSGGPILSAELAGYLSEVQDDLFSVVDPETPTRGFFTNLDRTRRQGVEASATVLAADRVTFRGSAAWTLATFESPATLAAPGFEGDEEEEEAPGGEEGEVELPRVRKGDRFPMVPEWTFTLGAEYAPSPWVFRADGRFTGSQWMVGDEDNVSDFGKLGSYFILDAYAERRIGPARLFLRALNLLDVRHETFGIIAENVRAAGSGETVEPFFTPGRPFRIYGGISYQIR